MKRKLLGLACGLALMGISAGAYAQQIQIKIGTISAVNSPWHRAMQKFAEVADVESKGRLKVLPYTDGQLGDIQQMFSAMQLGTLEMGYFGLGSAVMLRGAEPLNIIYVPYLFDSKEAAAKVLNSEDFHKMYDTVAKSTGIRVFAAYGARSPRAVQTTKGPIMKPEDLKGMRIRVPAIDSLKTTFETLGAQVTPLGMTEIYTAMSRGTIDGQDNGFDLSIPLRFQEAAKYWSATDHAYEVTGWFVSERFWRSLTDADRGALETAAKAGGAVTTELTEALDHDAIALIKEAGGTYVVPDREAFKAALAGVYKKYEGKVWPAGMVEKIRAMQK